MRRDIMPSWCYGTLVSEIPGVLSSLPLAVVGKDALGIGDLPLSAPTCAFPTRARASNLSPPNSELSESLRIFTSFIFF